MTVSNTSVVRVFSDGSTDPIYRLTYDLTTPITLEAGEYWFSHDATVIPEPVTMLGLVFGIGGLGAYIRRRRAV